MGSASGWWRGAAGGWHGAKANQSRYTIVREGESQVGGKKGAVIGGATAARRRRAAMVDPAEVLKPV